MDIEIDKDNLDLINSYEQVSNYLKFLNNSIIDMSEDSEDED